MSRLADYFAVIGYDHEKDRNGLGSGHILQRFPERDWSDSPFMHNLELFCQPQGWALSTERQEPKFFVSVFTDIDADRHYCAVLCFNEPISITPSKPTDEEEDGMLPHGTGTPSTPVHIMSHRHHSIMYAPKCLVLISSLDYFDTFRDCLGIVYTVYMEGHGISMETLIGNMVGYVQVPHPGGPQVRFSIGAGDRQALQPPASATIPVTHTAVYNIFNQLGIRNVLTLFSAALTEHQILFHSQSYCRLTDACRAIECLLYPFRYSHVYIPILPSFLVEILSSPTPYIMGVHSSLQEDITELMDVIVADLDGGSIHVPASLTLSLLPEPYWTNCHNALSMILHPELMVTDNAFSSSSPPKPSPILIQDKEIRTVFMRMFAELLQGYRSCLTIIRIHTKPVITFHKASFLGQHCLGDNDFLVKLLDCMFFNRFVSERGPPWRACDIWDELYASILEQIRQEQQDPRLLIPHIQEIAQQLVANECPNPQPFVAKIPKPTEGSFTRIHQPVFPEIDGEKVQAIINEGMAKRVKIPQRIEQLRIVPPGPHISSVQAGRGIMPSSARRLEVMRNCVNCIFENKISDARKTFPAVLRALKSKAARLALCSELGNHVSGNKAVLEHQQFDLVVRLMNCALQNDSALDEHGVAAALLPLSTAFCRKLCTGVIQFAYTCIQEHKVWENQQFWEAAFYQDVQKEIKGLYMPFHTYYKRHGRNSASGLPPEALDNMDQSWQDRRTSSYLNPNEPSALEIAAEQMRLAPTVDKCKLREMDEQEESMLYSQAIHYANRMVYLTVPLQINCNMHKKTCSDRDNNSMSITNSVAESDSMDAESGFEDQEQNDKEQSVVKSVSRFVDKVCTEGYVIEEHIKALHQMIPGVVAMHIEMLDSVYKESKRLPPIQKPKIPLPSLIPGEEIISERLRVFLLPDGREEGLGGHHGGPSLIPAEGALFLTNYRLIFKGQPTDPFASELVVVRSMPVASITKEKRVSGNQFPNPINIDQWMNDGLQIRSNGFQLIKVAFDEEVSAESIESMRKLINRLRHPQSIHQMFAFTGHQHIPQTPCRGEKDKPGYGTLRVFAKKTLMKTVKAAGLKSAAKGNKRHKYVFPSQSLTSHKSMTSPGPLSLAQMHSVPGNNNNKDDIIMDDDLSRNDVNNKCRLNWLRSSLYRSAEELEFIIGGGGIGGRLSPIVDELEGPGLSDSGSSSGTHLPSLGMGILITREMDGKTLEKLTERNYYKDFLRLGLGSLHLSPTTSSSTSSSRMKGEFRVTSCNSNYQLCRSYPALLSVPAAVSDESLHRLSRLYHQGRLPVITWRHPRTKGLLLRGAGFHSKGVSSMMKGPPSGTSGAASETSLTLEQEKFLSSIVSTTPMIGREISSFRLSESSLSIDSLVQGVKLHGTSPGSVDIKDLSLHYNSIYPTLTPEISRKSNPLSKAMNTLRVKSYGMGSGASFNRWGSLRGLKGSQVSNTSSAAMPERGGTLDLRSLRYPNIPTFSLSSSTRLSMDLPSDGSSGPGEGLLHPTCKAALYVLGEKTQIKGIKPESFPKAEFIPVEYPEVRQIKSSFKKLMRACIPSSPAVEPEQFFYRAVENSEWMQNLSVILQCSGNIVNLMNMLGASVMLVLEDGWDFTAQVSSLAQLCLDPYYRTIEGFRALIEKEWLAFGHRFLHRSNLLQGSQASGFAPFFLQFLDAVHQIHRQFPLSFEFNENYLKFLAYHSTSGRFRTFLSDCELERAELGIMAEEDKRGSLSRHHKGLEACQDDDIYPGGGGSNRLGSPISSAYLGQSVFDYIEKMMARSTVFMNFLYVAEQNKGSEVLRPMYEVSALVPWSYLVGEELRHGSSYDPEVRTLDRQQEEEAEAADGTCSNSKRRIVMNGYDSMLTTHQDVFTYLLEELRHLELELGHLPQKWTVHWDKLELPPPESFNRQVSMTTQMVRHHGRTLYKRSTLEMLIRAKAAGNSGQGGDTPPSIYSHPHRFEKYNYTTPSYCDHCSSVLWGPLKTGMRCMDCGYNCHEKCIEQVPKNCTRYKSVRDMSSSVHGSNKPTSLDTTSVGSGVTSLQTASHHCYAQFSSNVGETRTHEAYLWKRGALLKNWKQRWFVLDTMKHQLRYYDTKEDPTIKGIIELSDVVSVMSSSPMPGAPKKVEDKAFFDLQTKRRFYNFCASDGTSAQEWIEKIQSCLQ